MYKLGVGKGAIEDSIVDSGVKDGCVISFQHHLRNGDLILIKVLKAFKLLGIKDITLAAYAIMDCHDELIDFIEDGTVKKIYTNFLSAKVARFISYGYMKEPAVLQTHGGRISSIMSGRLNIDITFIAAPCVDINGSIICQAEKSLGPLGYSIDDAIYSKYTVAVTDSILREPGRYIEVNNKHINFVAFVDKIGDSKKISFKNTIPAVDEKSCRIAENTIKVIGATPLFKSGFSYQAGVGGVSLSIIRSLRDLMISRSVKSSFLLGGIMKCHVDMLHEGLVERLYDFQCFDSCAIQSYNTDSSHYRLTAKSYVNPNDSDAFVKKLDYSVLGANEVDMNFNANLITGEDNLIIGGGGAHLDICAGSKISIVTTRLTTRKTPKIVSSVNTISTPGENIDVVVTECGIAVNPIRTDIIRILKDKGIKIATMEELKKLAEKKSDKKIITEKGKQVVAIVEDQFGKVIDYVYSKNE
ncbi:citrate lyase subunit alpha/citrate CoA-transferase [Marinobacterium sp. MBR-111]|uniref:citrate lyase subunit alpha n=1 Tax=Marinobacterium sp. MBR-111 TaxID=3156463 RepID=UPI003392F731